MVTQHCGRFGALALQLFTLLARGFLTAVLFPGHHPQRDDA